MPDFQRIAKELEGLEALDGLARPLAEVAGRATRSTPVKNALSGTWLGHQLHPTLTDIPIGAWVAAGLMDLTVGKWGGRAPGAWWLGVLAALPTATAGASDWSETYGSEQRVGLVHGLVHGLGNLGAASFRQRPTWPASEAGG